jgi:C4-dicarboxylate-specific signal transduction histidine kinase
LERVSGDPKLAVYLEAILATVRHQLGNAVNALKITLDVMQENFDHFDDSKRKEYLRRTSELLGRQTGMIEAMKSYSSVNASDQKVMDFRSFWDRFLANAIRRSGEEKVRLNHHLNIEHSMIMANPVALNVTMEHLFDNALEALDLTENPEISLRVSQHEDEILIMIQDNGCGIRKGDLPFVFMPLYTTKPGRRGMGLTIALKLLSKMRGRIEVASLSETGTEVNVWLKITKGERDEQTVQV